MRLYRYIKKTLSKFPERVAYLTANSKFVSGIFSIRKEWGIDVTKDSDKTMARLLFDDRFDRSISKLMKINNLEESLRDWLYRYVIYNDTNSFNPEAAIIVQEDEEFYIKILPETNIEDVGRAFKIIKKLQERKNKRIRIKKNLSRDKEILELRDEGKSPREIYGIMLKKGHDLDFANIKNILSRINKKIKG